MAYTKSDIMILKSIRKLNLSGKTGVSNEFSGVPVSSIIDEAGLSHTKIRATIKMLQSNSFIDEGFMQKNAKTYYITKDGEELLNRLFSKNKESV